MRVRLIDGVNDVPAEQWNQISRLDYPFIRHEFLLALEKSGCVSEQTGWLPQHCLIYQDDELLGIMPLYRKLHSQGEYVFDYQWADAYQLSGLRYYPKWLTAIPFTPCEGKRICVKQGAAESEVVRTILDFMQQQATEQGLSSWHCLFPPIGELESLRDANLIIRQGVQFRWINRNYRDFKDYLDRFNAKKRKSLLRERRLIRDQGISLQQICGRNITERQLMVFFQFYQLTYAKHGRAPYLNLLFFNSLRESMPEQLLLILAQKDGAYVGAAFSLLGDACLYGRYWGCYQEYNSLHFEACYYQGLEFCIDNGLQGFDSGAQGEHKIARGFEPQLTYSAHWIADAEFSSAIEAFTRQEACVMEKYRNDATRLLPFKNEG